ncbi:MAG: ATP-dependent RNA helicase HrpA [Planctomycetota bacterium]|jgi:ATP-dependent helicase HrpA
MTADHLNTLSSRLDQCMLVDQPRLRRQAQAIRRDEKRGRAVGARLRRLAEAVDDSVACRREREVRRPQPEFPPQLPVVEHRQAIADALASHQVVVVCGETGSGKSTQLPKICLEMGLGAAGMIGHTQPRRVAARSIAARIAHELHRPVGEEVGYKIRFSDRTGPRCFIKVVTDGMLLAETRSDRALRQYDTIIIDEAHERSLNIDFLLGYLKRLLPRRPELKLIITSATIDPASFSAHFGDAPIIEVSGRTFPVQVLYRPPVAADPDDREFRRSELILDAVDEVAAAGRGDILVFLPGEREIRETAEALRKHHPPQTEILPLYARLSASEQDRVFRPHPGRRIVLATNVAETSLTVPGVHYVVDPGLARISRYSPRRKVQLLPIEPVSQASADQRAGRCGRVAEGVCIRLYEEADYRGREAYTEPEILRTNLASVILQMHALELGRVEDFPFLQPPRRVMVRDGYATLHELGALDESSRLTEVGRQLASLPVDPRIGRMLLEAEREDCLSEVLVIAAALSVPDPRERPMEARDRADAAQQQFVDESSDFMALLNIWAFYHDRRRHLSWNKLRRCCQEHFLSFMRMREWVDVHRQLKRLMTESGHHLNDDPATYDRVHRAILAGLLSNIAMKGDSHAYTGAGGKLIHVHPGSGLFRKGPKWIVAAELVETTRLYARLAAKIQPEWLERLAPHLVQRRYADPVWSERSGRVMANETVTLFGLTIVPRRRVHYGPIDPVASRELFIHHGLVEGEMRSDGPFLEHNRTMLERIETLQAKSRRRDLLADALAQYAFYDARLPGDVYSTSRFERWRRQSERKSPRLLYMQESDLLVGDAGAVTREQYPDQLDVGGVLCSTEYRHEPGHPEDGVTVLVPLAAAGQVDARRLEWLVPAYLQEKITALLRSLPKALRRNFVPAPDFAAACAARLEPGTGSLPDAIASALEAMTGIEIPPDAWSIETLPDHLRMNVRIIDEQGEAITHGRDLAALRRAVGAEARQALAASADDSFNRHGLVAWDVGDLPEQVRVRRGGAEFIGHPALVDEQNAVGLQLLDTSPAAAASHRAGVRRLLRLQLAGEIDFQLPALPGIESMRLQYAAADPSTRLDDELALLIAERACLGDDPPPRTAAGFEACLNGGFSRIWEVGLEIAARAGEILEVWSELATGLDRPVPDAWAASVQDIRGQLADLLPARFLTRTPWDRLGHLPRYLRGAALRFQRLAHGGHRRDERALAELDELRQPYVARAAQLRADGIDDPACASFRWLLEEWRIALFAQELGTVQPVSRKRLARAWSEVRS